MLCTQHEKLLKKSSKAEEKTEDMTQPTVQTTNKRLKKPKEKIILTDKELRKLRLFLSLQENVS